LLTLSQWRVGINGFMRNRKFNSWFLLFVFMSSVIMGVIFIYSIILPPPKGFNSLEGFLMLNTHFIVYFGFSLLVYETFRTSPWNLNATTRCLLTFMWVFLYSCSLELLQLYAPLRQFELADISLGFLGAFSGAVLMVMLRDYPPFTMT